MGFIVIGLIVLYTSYSLSVDEDDFWKVLTESSHLESTGHGLAEPDVLLLSDVLAEVPVLHGDAGLAGVDASLASLHVAVDLDGIQRRALVGINPVNACNRRTYESLNQSLSSCYTLSKGSNRALICTHRSSTQGGTSSGHGTCGQGSSGYHRGYGSSRPSASGS